MQIQYTIMSRQILPRKMLFFPIIVLAISMVVPPLGASGLTASDDQLTTNGDTFLDQQQQQQLANEKMQLLYSQRQQQHQDSYQMLQSGNNNDNRHNQITANDLLEQPEVEVQTDNRRRKRRPQQQAQQQQQQKLLSQGVINGNHATYVEPPADFKPIIYDFDDRQANQQQAMAGESSDGSMLNELMPASHNMGSSINQQQQLLPRPSLVAVAVDPLPISSGGSSSSGSSDYIDNQQPSASMSHVEHQVDAQSMFLGASDQSELTQPAAAQGLKPSVGRWSDWHDMSIEPDLASSDTLVDRHYSQVPGHYASGPIQQLPVQYKTRYAGTAGKTPVAWIGAGQKPEALMMVQFGGQAQEEGGQHSGGFHQLQPATRQQVEQANSLPQITNGVQHQQHPQPVPRRFVASNQAKRPQPAAAAVAALDLQSQIKGSKSSLSSSTSASSSMPAVKGSKLPLNLISQNSLLEMKLNEHKIQNSNQLQDQELFWKQQQQQVMSQRQQQQQQLKPLTSDWEQQVPMPTKMQLKSPSNQRKLKRRRKSKSNAEVRIFQLVAASQQQQLAADQKQANGLTAHHHNQQQQQVDPAVKPLHQEPQQLVERAQLAKQRQQTPAAMVVKRFGGASTSANATATIKRTSVKRPRIRTLLPVGLSSWILGGIRALDGKHWQLPSEVVSRLAVNDVDFGAQPPKVAPPSAGSVVMIGSGLQGGTGGPAEQTTASPVAPQANRAVPINQLVPR